MAKPKKQEQVETKSEPSYIEPTLKFDDKHKNEFIEHVKNDEPELTAVGYARIPGTNNYSAYVIKIVGDKVIKMIVDEPNLKLVAEESAKIQFVNEFVRNEEF